MGALCREEGIEGLKYWENWLVDYHDEENEDGLVVDGQGFIEEKTDEILQGLKATGLL